MDETTPSCCPPPVARPSTDGTTVAPSASATRPESVEIPGGTGFIGTDRPILLEDAEGPFRQKRIAPFRIGTTTVTNADFAAFIDDTGYVTEAEDFGWSFVFWAQVPEAVGPTQAIQGLEWWRRVDGATWRAGLGPGSDFLTDRPDHPVVHVSWRDATAYARWIGGRLPSEAEWEHAARGGLGDVPFPWGEAEPNDTDHFPCNIWQGQFPQTNTGADGHLDTAPAQSFAPNGYGLFNMVGNVWEWTAEPFRLRSQKKAAKTAASADEGLQAHQGWVVSVPPELLLPVPDRCAHRQ